MHSKSEMKRVAMLDPQKAADELMKLRAERDRYREALEKIASESLYEPTPVYEQMRDLAREALRTSTVCPLCCASDKPHDAGCPSIIRKKE